MAICYQCHKDMRLKKSCNGQGIKFPDGKKLAPVPYERGEPGNCHDCFVPDGGFHHPGCDMERCPRCEGQLISCGCLDEEQGND